MTELLSIVSNVSGVPDFRYYEKDDKGKAVFCHATYSEQEISITQIRI